MIKKTILAASFFAAFASSFGQTVNASHDYIVEDTGTFGADTNFINWGLAGGRFKSFLGLDFNGGTYGSVSSVTSAVLTVQESDFTSTSSVPVNITVWAVTDNVTSLAKGQTAIEYNDGVLGGYTNQLGTATQLGTFVFNPSGLTNGGLSTQNDVINLTTGLGSLASLINSSNQVIRLILTTNETGEVTWAGAGTSSSGTASAFVPELTLQATSAPEPASMAFLGLGIMGLASRKLKK